MGTNLINPVAFADIKPLMNEAARKFLADMEKGEQCKFALSCPVADADNNPNTIHADVIRFCAWGGDEKHRVTGNLIHLEGAVVHGQLDLLYADIRFALTFMGCHFTEEVVVAFAKCPGLNMDSSYLAKGMNANGMQIKGALCLRNNFTAHGEVRLADAKISGGVDCRKSMFINPTKEDYNRFSLPKSYALFASGMEVNGHFEARESAFIGAINMDGSYVGGTVNFMQATLQGGLFAVALETKRALVLQNIEGTGSIVLSFSKAGVLVDNEKESRAKFKFALNGFTYQELHKPDDVKSRIDWLDNRPTGLGFSQQPFEQIAKVLFARGQDSDAREILLEKEQQYTRIGKMSRWDKFWRRAWHLFAGYGYRLQWTAAWMLVTVLMGTAFFNFADNQCRIVPHQPVVMKAVKNETAKAAEKCTAENRPTKVVERAFPDYPRFGAFVYSLDVFIPYFSLYQESHWYPQPTEADTDYALVFLRVWYWIEIVAGWILTSLLVLTVTGLLQPRQSSGGK